MLCFYSRIVILTFLFAGWGCDSKEFDDEYIGENGEFFHAKINGKDWYPQVGIFGPPIELYASYGGPFSLHIIRDYDPESNLFIKIDHFNGIGTYTLADTSSKSYIVYYVMDTPTNNYYSTDNYNGTIEITGIDTIKRLISGRISFEAIDSSEIIRPALIQLREGKFIAHYTGHL